MKSKLLTTLLVGLGGLLALAALPVLALAVVNSIWLRPFTIPSAADEPTLYQGDYLEVSRGVGAVSRGDTLVFRLPRDGRINYIKRLVGLPGETVQLRRGVLVIDDRPLTQVAVKAIRVDDRGAPERAELVRETTPEGRSYLIQSHGGDEMADNTAVYHVPPHCYFMMGDNRENSLDSRFDPGLSPDDPNLGGCGWNNSVDSQVGDYAGVGFVPEQNLVGEARFVLLSWRESASVFKPWTWFDLRWRRSLSTIH